MQMCLQKTEKLFWESQNIPTTSEEMKYLCNIPKGESKCAIQFFFLNINKTVYLNLFL